MRFPAIRRKFPDRLIKFPDNISKFPVRLSREFRRKSERRQGLLGCKSGPKRPKSRKFPVFTSAFQEHSPSRGGQRLPSGSLFWLNTISAVVNNSTLAVVEIGPTLSVNQQRAALLGLLISGGMLFPGNIANIVAASRLRIGSHEWAKIGVPMGIAMLGIYFALLKILGLPAP